MTDAVEFKNQGNVAFKAQNFEEAANLFGKAIELDSNNHVLYSNRSGAYASLQDYDKALEDATKCVELKADWPKGYIRKGLAQFYLKKYDEAIATYDEGLKLEPTNVQLKEGRDRAETEKITGGKQVPGMDNSKVAGVIEKLKANPKTAAYLSDPQFVQQVQMFLGNPDMMKQNPQMLMQVIQKDPRFMDCFMVLQGMDPSKVNASFGDDKGDSQEPQEENFYEEKKEQPQQPQQPQQQQQPKQEAPKKPAQSAQPVDEATKLKNEGNQFYKEKKFDEALEKYSAAIALKPEEILFYNNKAAVFIEQKNYTDALVACEEALKAKEDHMIYDFQKVAKIYARLGSVYQKLGDLQKSIEWYNKSLIEDQNSNVKHELRKVENTLKIKIQQDYLNPELGVEASERGKERFQAGVYSEALDQYADAIKRDPKVAKYFFNRGLCYIKLMEWAKAVEDFDGCIALDNQYTKAYIKKGDCQTFMKEYHKAKTSFGIALEQDPENAEVKQKIQGLQSKMFTGGSKEEKEQRAQQAMKDPEIQQIMMTPEIQNALKSMQQNPNEAMKILQDPKLGPKIQRLIEAGVLQTQ